MTQAAVQKLRSVQALRGLAACGVALMHAHFFGVSQPLTPNWTQLGAAGVDLFFVISGFIMATIPKRSPGSFMADRIWRIYPVWWIALLPWLLLVPTDWTSRVQMIALWPVTGTPSPFLNVRWTLSFELLFYAAVAITIRKGPAPPLMAFGAALVAGAVTHFQIFNWLGNPMIIEFLFGVIIAKLPRSPRFAPLLVLIAVVVLAVSPLRLFLAEIALDRRLSAIRVCLWGLPAAFILYAALATEELIFQRRWLAPLVLLGDASYSIYLYHGGALKLLHMPWPIEFIAAVCLGVAVWWLLERPLMARKRAAFARLVRWLEGTVGRRGRIGNRQAGAGDAVLGDSTLQVRVED